MSQAAFHERLAAYPAGVVIDIGTGDGRFVCEAARLQPEKFYIGVDANADALAKISEKLHRKPAKGGLPNALFLQAAVEALPSELTGLACEVHVQFPWGSLLRGVVNGEAQMLDNLRRICSTGARLQILLGLDPMRDQSEIARLGLPSLTDEYLANSLPARYRAHGFTQWQKQLLTPSDWLCLTSSWAKRLRNNPERTLIALTARAVAGKGAEYE